MNTFFKNILERKRIKYNTDVNKAMRILNRIFQTNIKLFVAVSPQNERKLEFADHQWLSNHDKPQSDAVFFVRINCQIITILVTKRKHVIGPNNIITLNEEL